MVGEKCKKPPIRQLYLGYVDDIEIFQPTCAYAAWYGLALVVNRCVARCIGLIAVSRYLADIVGGNLADSQMLAFLA